MWKVDVVPVLQREIGPLKDQPDEDRPWDHEKKFFSSIDEEGVAFQTVDDCIDGEDIGPPGKTVKPAIEGLHLLKMKKLREDEHEKAKNSINWKDSLHRHVI